MLSSHSSEAVIKGDKSIISYLAILLRYSSKAKFPSEPRLGFKLEQVGIYFNHSQDAFEVLLNGLHISLRTSFPISRRYITFATQGSKTPPVKEFGIIQRACQPIHEAAKSPYKRVIARQQKYPGHVTTSTLYPCCTSTSAASYLGSELDGSKVLSVPRPDGSARVLFESPSVSLKFS